MRRLIKKIANASPRDAEQILNAIIRRYAQLYPDWDLHVFSVQKGADENKQIDQAIALFESFRPNSAADPSTR